MKEQFIRYSNRKTYSLSQKKYVNLDVLLSKLANGEGVTVTQKGTGEDVTQKVVKQAIAVSKLDMAEIKKALGNV
jgi:polyhydroxyalkanoate synthesis regulator protein